MNENPGQGKQPEPSSLQPWPIKIPSSRVREAGVILLALWVIWSIVATFVSHDGTTWSVEHRVCESGLFSGVSAVGSATCSRLNGAYTLSTIAFWIGLLLLVWYFGARVLDAFLRRPGQPTGGSR